ncbi:hypothetical protein QQA_2028 [Clostridioides difficile Y343]|nr:hypothetical protein QQA_2028 [Clostridioides difficile Y343]
MECKWSSTIKIYHKITCFILTIWNVNNFRQVQGENVNYSFILTIWNVNS